MNPIVHGELGWRVAQPLAHRVVEVFSTRADLAVVKTLKRRFGR